MAHLHMVTMCGPGLRPPQNEQWLASYTYKGHLFSSIGEVAIGVQESGSLSSSPMFNVSVNVH